MLKLDSPKKAALALGALGLAAAATYWGFTTQKKIDDDPEQPPIPYLTSVPQPAQIISNERLSENILRLRIHFSDDPQAILGFKPGQTFTITVNVAKSAGEPLKTLDFSATPVSLENKDRVAEATVFLPKGMGQDHYLATESKIEVSGPSGTKFYLGNGKFSISGKEVQTKRVAFITDEYGIGEFYSILRQINADESDKTRSLIQYQIDNEENCALKQSLYIFDEREYLTIHMHVINPSRMWKGFSGEIDQDHLIESQEDPLDNLTIFVKLSPARQGKVLGMLKQIRDVKPENVITWEDAVLDDDLPLKRRTTSKRSNENMVPV